MVGVSDSDQSGATTVVHNEAGTGHVTTLEPEVIVKVMYKACFKEENKRLVVLHCIIIFTVG